MAAKAYFSVKVIFGIGSWRGEWSGKEERMDEQYTILCDSPSKEYAELLYKNLIAGRSFEFQEPIQPEPYDPNKPEPRP